MPHQESKVLKLKELGVFRTSDAIRLGFSQPTLSRLAAKGVVNRLEQGYFVHKDGLIDPRNLDFAVACAKFGTSSYIGAISALYRYGLIEQAPDHIWVICPPTVKNFNKFYRCLRTKIDLSIGIENHRFYRVSNVERTVVDGLYFSTKLGIEITIGATRKAIKTGLTSDYKIYDMAKKVGLTKSFEKYWEAVISD